MKKLLLTTATLLSLLAYSDDDYDAYLAAMRAENDAYMVEMAKIDSTIDAINLSRITALEKREKNKDKIQKDYDKKFEEKNKTNNGNNANSNKAKQ